MRNPKILNRTAALIALFFILFQSFALPVAAVAPWTGDPWKGDTWEGDTWEGDSWEGDSWEGDTWEGDTWEGDTWEGDSWEGDTWEGKSWNQGPGEGVSDWNGSEFNGNPWNAPGYNGNPWNAPGYNGNPWNAPGYNGNPWNAPGYNGNPWNAPGYNGNPWNAPGYNGNPWNAPGYNGNPWNTPGYNGSPWNAPGNSGGGASTNSPTAYDVTKYIANDVVGGQVSMIGSYTSGGSGGFGAAGGYMTGMLLNGVKMGMGERTPWYVNAASDAKDFYDKGKGVYDAGSTLHQLRTGGSFGSTVARGASTTAPAIGAVSKLSAVGAGISAGFSAVDTAINTKKAIDVWNSNASGAEKTAATADATASFGETLFNAGMVSSAIPGGQAVGAGLMVAGGVVWGASKVTKFFADGTAKKAWNKTKDVAKNTWNKFKGLFGK
ncbi:hypothetical protein JOC94_002946 [Bacillus thermophilus]|uniref:Uncharacterized protein n=1 Tax=Siminovitchia thermophila TaxID=1245522 RepID=A0ABS2R990_9BACI|nr:hypothetical protein [Siminovitchia thermophila]MBM7715935.1 hypothetical protein [Siminovitchia thermophila]ONK21568.1 hypothetical protein BLX87_20285 [Bacillus sp. VT-16-64]